MVNRFLFNDLAATKLLPKLIYLGGDHRRRFGSLLAASKLMGVSEAEEALGMITRKLKR